jgi:hypothetical protein
MSNVTRNVNALYKNTKYLAQTSDTVADYWTLANAAPEYYYYQKNYLSVYDQFSLSPI